MSNSVKREFKFKLPLMNNNGKSLSDLHKQVEVDLCNKFGGLTKTNQEGAWVNPIDGKLFVEPVVEYIVAINPDDQIWALLYVRNLGEHAKQEAMYVVKTCGNVSFINIS